MSSDHVHRSMLIMGIAGAADRGMPAAYPARQIAGDDFSVPSLAGAQRRLHLIFLKEPVSQLGYQHRRWVKRSTSRQPSARSAGKP
jgi:hypothetical protein